MRRQVKAVLVGAESDPNFEEAFQIARCAQRNFEPLWRCFITSTSGVEEETQLLGTASVYQRAQCAFTVEGRSIVGKLADGGLEGLKTYLQDKLLVEAMCKQLRAKGVPLSTHHLSITPIFHEPMRQGSYIITTFGSEGVAVICVDPTIEVATTISHVDHVILTHTPCDCVSGLPIVLRRFPTCTVATEFSTQLEDGLTLGVSMRSSPGYTPDCCNVEISATFEGITTLGAVILSPTIGLDGLCRLDFAGDSKAIETLHSSMLAFKEQLLKPDCGHVLLLCSRGGYNVCNSQLETFWGTYVLEILRKEHVRPMWRAVGDGVEAFRAFYSSRASALPNVGGGGALRRLNISGEQPAVWGSPRLTIDLRDQSDFFDSPVVFDAVNIPLDDPPTKADAKKAEIWLSCVVAPSERVRMVFPPNMPVDVVFRRLSHIGICREQVERITDSKLCTSVSQRSMRLVNYAGLRVLDKESTLVVDIRTTEEFKNGSHVKSIHFPLSDILADWQRDPSGGAILEALFMKAYQGNKMTSFESVVLYCAGGYRTHITATLLRSCTQFANRSILDVAGGAFQLMTQRPDMWHVKDRSIICIS